MQRRENHDPESVKNKAGYTASPVACGWAWAVIEVTLGKILQKLAEFGRI